MRTVLVVLAILLLMPGGMEAKREKRDVIVVRDYTSAAWDGVIEQTVEDFNAVMPKNGPKLVYERAEAVDCYAMQNSRKRSLVKVCSFWTDRHVGSAPFNKNIWLSDHFTGPWYDQFRAVNACHELMHVLTKVHDNHGALPDQSCVWGNLSQPGPFDIDLLRKAYKRKHR